MKKTFSFGKNWIDYVKNALTQEKIESAKISLLNYIPEEEYKDKVFIDIGCGSGIFSLNALRLGCKKVISFDIDEYSIKATRIVKEKFSYLLPENYKWEIFKGNILDEKLVNKLKEKGDIVYAWGVLHHTGNMWQAIKNASLMVKKNGYFIIAIYNKAPYSYLWLKIKKFYNNASPVLKSLMIFFFQKWILLEKTMQYYYRKIRRKKFKDTFNKTYRGMNFLNDLIDWIGGYPYEYASFGEAKNFLEKLGFELIKTPTKIPFLSQKDYRRQRSILRKLTYSYFKAFTGNNEFVFKK